MSASIQIDPSAFDEFQAMGDKFVVDSVLPKIAANAKRIVPVDTGHLQENIHPEVSSEGMFVVADTEYAAFVEQGTSKMAAQPYLRPALNINLGA